MLVMIASGLVQCADGTCPQAHVPHPIAAGAAGSVGLFVVLRAFASGAAALTGVESISNGVNAFRPPQGRNAAKTLLWMGAMAISLFIGVSYLAVHMHASPSETVSVVSEIARGVFPSGSAGGWMYYAIQGLTFAVLILAANTSYQGFPRLSAVLARDRYFPRQFVNLGDRLVYSNGIIVLAGLASLLIWAFNADVNALIHLYVIGVFTAFTMSQSGMVRYWLRHKHDAGWRRKAVINGAGAVATSVVAVLVIQTKFLEGAWAVAVAIPILIASFYGVHRHYQKVARRLRAGTAAVVAAPPPTNQVVLYVDSLRPGAAGGGLVREADLRRQLPRDPRPERDERYRDPSPLPPADGHPAGSRDRPARRQPGRRRDRLPVGAATRRVDLRDRDHPRGVQAPLPARRRRPPNGVLAQGPAAEGARSRGQRRAGDPAAGAGMAPTAANRLPRARLRRARRIAARRQLREHAATSTTRGRCSSHSTPRRPSGSGHEWKLRPMPVPLEIEEAHFRDLGDPLLAYLRRITADPETMVVVVLPELIFSGPQRLLHNQRALYIKRLLLFEPQVILTSVPYRLS